MEQALILPLNAEGASLANVGGKGMNLAKLARAGFPVPPGFIVTTAAYRTFVDANRLQTHILELARNTDADDPISLENASQSIRRLFQEGAIPQPVADAVRDAYHTLPQLTIHNSQFTIHNSQFTIDHSVAVRSSATAEDLPGLSFAGQQDTYLNIVGDDALLEAVVQCWSSLWTARAIGYRTHNGIPHEGVALAVAVQEMVQSEASGVLFTANPLNGKRTETVIDATLGLGEALVSGQVSPDHYVVNASGHILGKALGAKEIAIRGQAGGGTVTVEENAGVRQALPDEAISKLAELGRQVADLLNDTFRILLPQFLPRMAAGMGSLNLLTRLALSVPDGKHNALEMTRGLPHNVTTEMDLVLWDTARTIKSDPSSAARFRETDAQTLAAHYLAGRLPATAQSAIADFLERYGVRGIGEIDLGRPRWREDPTPIMQSLQSYMRIEEAKQAPNAIFKRGAISAEQAIDRLVKAARRTPRGWFKAWLVRAAARRMRALAGLRESPKFFAVRMMGIVRQDLLDSGRELTGAGTLSQPDDIFFLRLAELKALAIGAAVDWQALVARRREVYAREKRRRQIPRVLLSDGQAFYEGVSAPAQAGDGLLAGSPVSPGVVEGAVHVVFDPHGAQLAPGEILVCPGTDPAWTPLFLAAGGLVMEVGGLMTHGAVVAREYGIPAVVGVHQATTRLKTGQRIRVDGSTGQVVVLDHAGG